MIETDLIRVKEVETNMYVLVNINEVLYFIKDKNFSKGATRKLNFIFPVSEAGLCDIVYDDKYPFIESDKYIYINANEMRKLHSKLNLVFFSDTKSVKEAKEKNLPMVFMHSSRAAKIKALLGVENDLAYKLLNNRDKRIYKRNVSDELTY